MPSNNWDRVIGQERAKKILRSAIRSGRLSHAYFFWGIDGIGKEALALEFARTLLCEAGSDVACGNCPSCKKMETLQHPDLKLIFPLPGTDNKKDNEEELEKAVVEEVRKQTAEKAVNPYFKIAIPKANVIRINTIKKVKKESSLSSIEKGKKVFVIFEAEAMNDASANSLLKVLEEPLENVHFFLVSSRKDQIRQTILSRCQLVHCSPLTDSEIQNALIERINLTEEQAKFLTRMANGSYAKAIELASEELNHLRYESVNFLRGILGNFPIKFLGDFEEYFSSAHREKSEQLLLFLLVFFRDALMTRETASSLVMNADQVNEIEKFVARFGMNDLYACQSAVEHALELLRRNVYLPLVILSLTASLRRILLK